MMGGDLDPQFGTNVEIMMLPDGDTGDDRPSSTVWKQCGDDKAT